MALYQKHIPLFCLIPCRLIHLFSKTMKKNLTKIVFLSVWYCPLYPAVLFMAALALWVNYFMDRFSIMVRDTFSCISRMKQSMLVFIFLYIYMMFTNIIIHMAGASFLIMIADMETSAKTGAVYFPLH